MSLKCCPFLPNNTWATTVGTALRSVVLLLCCSNTHVLLPLLDKEYDNTSDLLARILSSVGIRAIMRKRRGLLPCCCPRYEVFLDRYCCPLRLFQAVGQQ